MKSNLKMVGRWLVSLLRRVKCLAKQIGPVFLPLTLLLSLLYIRESRDDQLEILLSSHRNSASPRLWIGQKLNIQPCCAATVNTSLSTFMKMSGQCQQKVLMKEGFKCGCEEVIACKMVVVTAFSMNHFEELKDFLASMQTHMPMTPILVYDLSNNNVAKEFLNLHCNIKAIEFDFSKYPYYVHNLKQYGWKPLVMNEVVSLGQYEVVMWSDASCRIRQPLYSLLPRLAQYPIIPGPTYQVPFVATTHDDMLKYLKIHTKRSVLDSLGQTLQTTGYIMWANEDVREKFLKHWVDCGLHKECMAPEGTKIPCNIWWEHCSSLHLCSGKYISCHRYDQSAYNAILFREYGPDFVKGIKQINSDIQAYISIYRGVSHLYKLRKQCLTDGNGLVTNKH